MAVSIQVHPAGARAAHAARLELASRHPAAVHRDWRRQVSVSKRVVGIGESAATGADSFLFRGGAMGKLGLRLAEVTRGVGPSGGGAGGAVRAA